MAKAQPTADSIGVDHNVPKRQARSIPIETRATSDSLNARDRKVVQELLEEHVAAYDNWEENGRPGVLVKANTYRGTRLIEIRLKGKVLLSARIAERVEAARYMDMVSYSTGTVKFEFEYQI